MRRPLLTIKGKTSLLFSGLGLLLLLTGTMVFLQLTAIQVDAERLVEETRESVISSEMHSTIHDIEVAVRRNPGGFAEGSNDLRRLMTSMARFRELLTELRSGAGRSDPSRGEHQATEDRIAERIQGDMAALETSLGQPMVDTKSVFEKLAFAKRYAQVLSEETREESGIANADLNKRAEEARWMLWGSFSLVILGFLWISFYFIRHVASPILALRDGAERFGRGDLGYRMSTGRRDEIGELAAGFNEMAERIGTTHGELEESLAERTRDFIRAARFADLGVLAAGLAHEINNPLASIATSAEGLERRIDRGGLDAEETSEYLRTIAAEAYRAKGITERLLALSRAGEQGQGMVDLGLVLGHVEMMFRHQIQDRGMELRLECGESVPWVYGSPESFVQVFSNLLRNAEDVSPPGGVILIRCTGDTQDFRIEVLDEGPGLPEEEQGKIFDPFYTTKEPGKGTGLGLSLVTSLLESMGGRVEVSNRAEGGCCFSVYPALARDAQPASVQPLGVQPGSLHVPETPGNEEPRHGGRT